MRKMYKCKKCCCAACKGHKRGKAVRWTGQDEEALYRFERLKQTNGQTDTRYEKVEDD